MNKFIKIVYVIAVAFILNGCANLDTSVIKPNYDFSKIKRVAVLDFKDVSNYKNAGPMVSDLFVKYLLATDYNVVERTEINAILREHQLSVSGVFNSEQIKQFGKISGVDAIVTGSVVQVVPERTFYEKDGYLRYLAAEVAITARMIDVETGEILWVASGTYDAVTIQTAFDQLVCSFVQSFEKALNKKE